MGTTLEHATAGLESRLSHQILRLCNSETEIVMQTLLFKRL